MDAAKKTINDIFNGNRILEIPFFQRSYVWGDDQWERLLEDMEIVSAIDKPYFLGSVILKQQPTQTGNNVGDVRTVIDGQQRLTSLNIFLKVLCLKNEQMDFFNGTFRLMFSRQIALHHNHNDVRSFERVLALESLEEIEAADNILKAYNYFKNFIQPEKLNIQNILARILFVAIDLDANENEQQIFDTINSLGVRLTTAELLKNYFFKRDQLDAYNKFWKSIFENDQLTKQYWDREITTGRVRRTFIDMFFFSYLQIKIQESGLKIKTEDKVEFSKVETLFESYKSLIEDYKLDKQSMLSEIKDYAVLFRNNFDYKTIERELSNEYGIDRINAIIFGLETSTLISYVLFILKNVQNQAQRNELFECLESYVMRRMVIHATTKNYNQLFTDRLISNNILSAEQFNEYIETKSDKINYFPSDDELKAGFHNSIIVNKQSAGIIYLIESRIRNRNRQGTQLLGISKYSLEHLMPKKWTTHWGNLERENIDKRKRKLLTLGNLAIITQALNASIKNANWKTKKEGRGNKAGLIRYSAGIETLAPYLNLPEWNETEIEKRANYLYQCAVQTWKKENATVENLS